MFGSDARGIGGAFEEGGLDAGALDAVLELVEEDRGDAVLVAVEEELREVVVGVDAGGEHDVEAALVGHPLAERGVAVEEHRARLDDGLHAMALDGVGVGDGGVPLGLLVIEVRELESPGLVGGAEVLVDERQAKLIDVHGTARGLNCGHARNLPPAGLGAPAAAPRAPA